MQATILENRWIPISPEPKQALFLLAPDRDALFGGAAGGGKSAALLAGALQYVEVPQYAGLLLRRTYADLALPGALMDLAQQWLHGSGARWHQETKTWHFPSRAQIAFGHMEHEDDKYKYQGATFQFIGIDELTQFTETQFRYMFSRLRRARDSRIPLRMRTASNPGGEGHDWVKARYITGNRLFIPAKLSDNPHLDREEYEEALNELDPVTRAQLLNGDWAIRPAGGLFKREWFQILDIAPAEGRTVRWWDMASAKPRPGRDPDWTVGLRLKLHDGTAYIEDVQRTRQGPYEVKQLVHQTARLDGPSVAVRMGLEPGSSGLAVADDYARTVLLGYDFEAIRETGEKAERAKPVSASAKGGRVKVITGGWIAPFLDEMDAFPEGSHDDQVDALSGAFNTLASAIVWGAV